MSQLTLFDCPEATAPIARHSDPATSHKAAERIQPTVTARQIQCLEVLREHGQPMTSSELAEELDSKGVIQLAVKALKEALSK